MADPTITGFQSTYTTDGASVLPFAGVTISDPVAGAIYTAEVYAPDGELSGITYNPSTSIDGIGGYRIIGTAAQVTAALDAVGYTPQRPEAGRTLTDPIYLDIRNSAGVYVFQKNADVVDVTAPDTVTLAPQVSYRNGVFTLTGAVTTDLGVTGVDVQAIVDGVPKDVGRVKINADKTFTLKDRVGPHTQTFITALTLNAATQGEYSPARDEATFSLTGGLGDGAIKAEQDLYTPDGDALASVSRFQADGVHTTQVLEPGQMLSADYTDTFDAHGQGDTTFVYNPGHGANLITEFRLRGAQHDTLSFSGADFNNSIASVLANSHGPGDGTGVIIVDPTTQDTVQLAGISKRSLMQHRNDISFHG